MLEKISNCYENIANIILKWDKIEWNTIVLIADKDATHNALGVYIKDNNYILSQELINSGRLDESDFYDIYFDIDDIISEMKGIFEKYKQEEWHKFIMKITKAGKIETKYSYEMIRDNSFEEQVVDEYKYLNISPRKEFEEYVRDVVQEII